MGTIGDPGEGEADRRRHALDASEQRFSLLVHAVKDYAIFMIDPEGRVASWNAGAERIKGYAEDEVLGRHFSVFYTPEDRAADHPGEVLRAAAREGRYEEEGWRVRSDGSRFWASVTVTALRDASGGLVGFAKVSRDLTERRRAEEERERLLAEALAARTAAERANRAKSDFLATMSHEIRTPINAIMGYTELLDMQIAGPLTDEQRRKLERIRASSRHLLALIDDVLDLARVEAGRMRVQSERALAGHTVAAALSLVGPQAAGRGLELVDHCEPGLAYCADEDRVRQIVVNLLGNAVKFSAPGGTIAVRCEARETPLPHSRLAGEGPWATIRVEDTGIGIPPGQLDAVFEPFVQADSGHTRAVQGTGLGLTISRELARLMRGDLTGESEPGKGSAFTLWLPVSAPQAGVGEEGRSGLARREAMAAVGRALLPELPSVVLTFTRRLREDPAIPDSGALTNADLEDHAVTFLSDIVQSLVAWEESETAPGGLLRDGGEIQRVISELHGAQRARLGWSEEDVRREFEILREEVDCAVRGVTGGTPEEALAGTAAFLARSLDAAEAISRRAVRAARDPGG